MLKFIGRMIFFFAVSVLLAVGIYALVQRNPAALGLSSQFREPREGEFLDDRFQNPPLGGTDSNAGFFQGRQGMGFGEDDHDFEGRGSSALGLLGIGRNLVVIALITLVVAGLQKLGNMIFQKKSVKMVSFGG